MARRAQAAHPLWPPREWQDHDAHERAQHNGRHGQGGFELLLLRVTGTHPQGLRPVLRLPLRARRHHPLAGHPREVVGRLLRRDQSPRRRRLRHAAGYHLPPPTHRTKWVLSPQGQGVGHAQTYPIRGRVQPPHGPGSCAHEPTFFEARAAHACGLPLAAFVAADLRHVQSRVGKATRGRAAVCRAAHRGNGAVLLRQPAPVPTGRPAPLHLLPA